MRWQTRVLACVVVIGSVTTTPVVRAGWAEQYFAETSHDFGPVPRGAKVRHNFVLANRSAEPVSVVDVRASCGCTTGRASASVVPPGTQAVIEAEMDTRNFVGKKATVLTVTLAGPNGRTSEARLHVSSTILSDVVLNPGTVDFGAVGKGQSATQVLTIDRLGNPAWRVQRMASGCKAIDATLSETARNDRGVAYALKVTLKPDAPAGVVRDEIRIFTNDPETPVLPVQVTAQIRGELTASPGILSLGQVQTAAGTQGRFLVRGTKPFTVWAVEGEGDGFHAAADDTTAKPVHLITVTYRPSESNTRGDLRRDFRVHTDLVGEPPLTLSATLHVEPTLTR